MGVLLLPFCRIHNPYTRKWGLNCEFLLNAQGHVWLLQLRLGVCHIPGSTILEVDFLTLLQGAVKLRQWEIARSMGASPSVLL